MIRWYGTGTPELVFVERKTHRESWAGEVSVKERFIIPEKKVPLLLAGKFDMEAEIVRMREKGKKEEDIAEWKKLASEVVQAINSKQLEPTMRTQYMRTAFQIPFDATVRVSLDTNLTMINERTEESMRGERWFRDPNVEVPVSDITRFPHAVLEVKLELAGEGMTPKWVTELIDSGMLMQVHKFSKFIHGCASIMPEEVQAVPYWMDDVTLADSLKDTLGAKLLGDASNPALEHLIPHDKDGKIKAAPKPKVRPPLPAMAGRNLLLTASGDAHAVDMSSSLGVCDSCMETEERCFCSAWAGAAEDMKHITSQKVRTVKDEININGRF